MRILVIEEDSSLNKSLVNHLNQCGYQTDSSENFKDGEYFVGIRHYDLVLSSWTLPDGDSSELIGIVKQKSPRTILLILKTTNKVKSKL